MLIDELMPGPNLERFPDLGEHRGGVNRIQRRDRFDVLPMPPDGLSTGLHRLAEQIEEEVPEFDQVLCALTQHHVEREIGHELDLFQTTVQILNDGRIPRLDRPSFLHDAGQMAIECSTKEGVGIGGLPDLDEVVFLLLNP